MYFMNRISLGSNLTVIKNFKKLIAIENWTLSGDLYSTEVEHNLSSDNLMVSVYKDSTAMSNNSIEIINSNTIKIYNNEPMNCKVVILAKE